MTRPDLIAIAEQAVMDALGVPDRGGNRQRAHAVAVLVVDRLKVVAARDALGALVEELRSDLGEAPVLRTLVEAGATALDLEA